ncbi:hypothetical protein CC80DRAFT_547570 [Byssothecium circinans]|uniref:Uncharacterized protein n=1 Tax=Byssothecium circinans TaxID=147558 RepID=A0A6A5U3W7_9PLEO|nr:hypothetical protein CC80DRAFT_547570 [Byssothecium circinans]
MDFIQRHQPPTDESPPWSGIFFKFPVDSDILAERLKLAYPTCRTHRERKHQATIDFFSEELQRMRSKEVTPFSTIKSAEPSLPELSQDAAKVYSQAFSDSSRRPSASGGTSPSVVGSMDSPLVERVRPIISAGLSPTLQPPTTPTANAQQFVWNARDGKSMRPKTKRKMTVEERSAYKETRKRGACDKCRKQKGRCTHMIEEDAQPVSTYNSRRISTGPDAFQSDGIKSVKTEHSSDVHHLVPESMSDIRSPMSAQSSGYGPADELSEAIADPTRSDRDWAGGPQAELSGEGYVAAALMPDPYNNPRQGNDTWPPFSARNPASSVISGFTSDANINPEIFPTPMDHPSVDYQLLPGYSFYEGPWNNNQNPPMGGSGPS